MLKISVILRLIKILALVDNEPQDKVLEVQSRNCATKIDSNKTKTYMYITAPFTFIYLIKYPTQYARQ